MKFYNNHLHTGLEIGNYRGKGLYFRAEWMHKTQYSAKSFTLDARAFGKLLRWIPTFQYFNIRTA